MENTNDYAKAKELFDKFLDENKKLTYLRMFENELLPLIDNAINTGYNIGANNILYNVSHEIRLNP